MVISLLALIVKERSRRASDGRFGINGNVQEVQKAEGCVR